MTKEEVLDDLLARCDRTLTDPVLNQLFILGQQLGTPESFDFMRGASMATQTFKKELLKLRAA